MMLRAMHLAILAAGLMVLAPLDGQLVSKVYAGGGSTDDSSKTKTTTKKPENTKTKKKTTTKTKTKTKTKKKTVPVYADYKQSKLRKVRDKQSKLAGYAKKDKLKGIATNRKRLEAFVDDVTELEESSSGWKSIEASRIRSQLNRYGNQKKDKALRRCARAILAAFDVIHKLDFAESKRQKVKDAIKEKNPVKEALGRAEYSDARGDYHRAAKKLPPETRKLFTPLPKNPAN